MVPGPSNFPLPGGKICPACVRGWDLQISLKSSIRNLTNTGLKILQELENWFLLTVFLNLKPVAEVDSRHIP